MSIWLRVDKVGAVLLGTLSPDVALAILVVSMKPIFMFVAAIF